MQRRRRGCDLFSMLTLVVTLIVLKENIIHCLAKGIRTPMIILQIVRVPSNILTFVGASTRLYI